MNQTFASNRAYFFAIIQKPNGKKTYWDFVEGTGVMLTFRLAYKNMSSLRLFILKMHD